MADLETRIADAIGAQLSSKDIAALLDEVSAADVEAKAASERALNPATKPADVAKARKAMEDSDFRSKRMSLATERLTERHREAVEREGADARKAVQDAVIAERDQLAKDLQEYDQLSAKVGDLSTRPGKTKPGPDGTTVSVISLDERRRSTTGSSSAVTDVRGWG